jgi:hypothetical protein
LAGYVWQRGGVVAAGRALHKLVANISSSKSLSSSTGWLLLLLIIIIGGLIGGGFQRLAPFCCLMRTTASVLHIRMMKAIASY